MFDCEERVTLDGWGLGAPPTPQSSCISIRPV